MSHPPFAHWSITVKLVLVLLAVSLPPMVGTAYYNLRGSLETVANQEQDNLQLLAISLANRLDQLLSDTVREVRILAADQEVIGYLSHAGEDRERFHSSVDSNLTNILGAAKEFAHTYLMDQQGVFVATTNPLVLAKNYSHREYFRRAIRGELFTSELIFGTTSGEPGVYFSAPVIKDTAEILGVAVVKLQAEAITDILDGLSAHRQGVPVLLDRDGILIHHPDPAVRFHSLTEIPPEHAKAILATSGYPVDQIEGLGAEDLARLLKQQPAAGHSRFESRLGPGPHVIGYGAMTQVPWTVGVIKPEAQFAEPLNTLFHQAMFSVGLVGLMTLVVALLLGRAIAWPIAALTQAAGIMQRGTYKGREERFSPAVLGLSGVTRRRDELGDLARVFEDMAGQIFRREEQLESAVQARTFELGEKNTQLESAQRLIQEELKVAQSLQLSILPTRFPSVTSFDLYAKTTPARVMGGDFYDFFQLDDDRIGVVVADVSGKGVPAAFFMAVSRTLVQKLVQTHPGPGQVLALANDAICAENPLELFVTLFYGVLDTRSGRFRYANGGHNAPFRLNGQGGGEWLETTEGMALGVFEGQIYAEKEILLSPGDTLVLFTDGVTEAFNSAQEEFGEARLVDVVKHAPTLSAQQLTEIILDGVQHFTSGAEASDDITCLVLRFLGGRPMTTSLHIKIRNDLTEIPRLAAEVEGFAKAWRLAENDLFSLNLALDELLTNTISYGYETGEVREISVTLTLRGHTLTAVLEDDAKPFNPLEEVRAPVLEADLEQRPIGGLGVYFVRTFMDLVNYARVEGRNRVELIKHLSF